MNTIAPITWKPGSSPTPRCRVLLVDDDGNAADAMARLLRHGGYEVDVARTAAAAFDLLARQQHQIVLTDLMLPDDDGREVIRRARTLDPAPHCVLLTGWPLTDGDGGIARVFAKPVVVAELLDYLAAVPRPR